MAAERVRRILLTADTMGGVWSYAVELAKALQPRGIAVAIAAMGAPLHAAQRAGLDHLAAVTLHEGEFRLEWMDHPWADVERAGEWLLGLEGEFRPDIVHLNQFAFGTLPFAAPKLVVAHSCVLSWWNAVRRAAAPASWDPYRTAVRRGLEGADLVAAPSRAMLETLRDNYGFSGEAVVLPNARSAGDYAPGVKAPFVLAAGRLWDDAKNLGALEVVAPHIAWPIRVAGPLTGPGGSSRATNHVEVLGELSAELLRQELARAAIYALPARYEPFGLSILEAGLSGCALVLGDIPSLRELWGDAALFVDPDDYGALEVTLARLIADAPLRTAMPARARQHALRYSVGAMTTGYVGAYARLLETAPRRCGSARLASPKERACAS